MSNCSITHSVMGLLPDTEYCVLRMRRECREHFLRHRLLMKPLVSNPGMHHGTYVTHVHWCTSGLLTRGGGENVSGIPGACATRKFPYLVRGPLPVRQKRIGASWMCGITASRFWVGRISSLDSLHLALTYRYYLVWRRHENMSPCTDSRINSCILHIRMHSYMHVCILNTVCLCRSCILLCHFS